MMRRFLLFIVAVVITFGFSSCGKKKAGGDPIVIGLPTSLGLIEGSESLNAVMLAVDEINKAGGVKVGGKNRPLSVEKIDIRDGLPGVRVPEALLGIEKIILEKKPAALVVGPFRSEALMASMDIIAKHKVPLLGTIAMTPGTEAKIKKDPEKYKYIFRVSLNVIYWAKLLGGTMMTLKKEFGVNKVFLMNQDVAWARGTANAMKEKFFKKTGWDVTGHEQFPLGAQDFATGLKKVKDSGAEVLFVTFDMPESGILVKQWKSMQVPALIAGFISPMAGEVAWKTFDKNIGGLMNAIFELGNIPSDKYAPAKKFYNAYAAKFGKKIQAGHGPAPSYESVYLLKEAIERANSTDSEKIVAELEKTDRKGVMGRIKFDQGHQVIYGNDPDKTAVAAFYQWKDDGKRKIFYPASLQEDKIKLPSWVKIGKK